MDGRAEFLQVDWSTVKKGPRWKANMFRVLVLHQQGGVWVDTDTVFLRDVRPLVEFCGELASKLTMSLYVYTLHLLHFYVNTRYYVNRRLASSSRSLLCRFVVVSAERAPVVCQ